MKDNHNHQLQINQSINQSTNREVKTDPALDDKLEMKHPLAGLLARERELML